MSAMGRKRTLSVQADCETRKVMTDRTFSAVYYYPDEVGTG